MAITLARDKPFNRRPPAGESGIIVSINKKPVRDFDDAQRAISGDSQPLLLHILRKGRRLFIAAR